MRSLSMLVASATLIAACGGAEGDTPADGSAGADSQSIDAQSDVGAEICPPHEKCLRRWECTGADTYFVLYGNPLPCGPDCVRGPTEQTCAPGTMCDGVSGPGDTPCTPIGDAGVDGMGDTTPDTPYDGPAYTSDDFSSFRWQFYGGTGGPAQLFELDRDCGVDASQTDEFDGAVTTTACTVDPSNCDGFKSLVISSSVLGALESTAPCVPTVTDDPESTSVTVTSGVVYTRNTTGCADSEPFFTVQKELHRLEGLCVADGGADASDGD